MNKIANKIVKGGIVLLVFVTMAFLFTEPKVANSGTPPNMKHGCITDIHNGTEVIINEQDMPFNLTSMELCESGSNGFIIDSTGVGMVAQFSGVYKADYGISFSGTPNILYHLAIAVNDELLNFTMSDRKLGAGGDIGNSGSTGNINVSAGDLIHLQMLNADGTQNAFIEHATLTVTRIDRT